MKDILIASIKDELTREKIMAFIVALRLMGYKTYIGKNNFSQFYIEFSKRELKSRLTIEILHGEIAYSYTNVGNKYFSYNSIINVNKFYKMLDNVLIHL